MNFKSNLLQIITVIHIHGGESEICRRADKTWKAPSLTTRITALMRFCLSLPRAHVHITECEIIHCYPSLVGGSPVQAPTKAWSSVRLLQEKPEIGITSCSVPLMPGNGCVPARAIWDLTLSQRPLATINLRTFLAAPGRDLRWHCSCSWGLLGLCFLWSGTLQVLDFGHWAQSFWWGL